MAIGGCGNPVVLRVNDEMATPLTGLVMTDDFKFFMKLELTLDRLEGDKAVLLTKERETIIWPQNKLPAGAREGHVLVVEISDSREAQAKQNQTAKDILNEVLRLDEQHG